MANQKWDVGGVENCVARSRPSLSTHFRLLALSKYELTEVEKAKIQDVAFHYLGILYILAYAKCDLGEFEETYSQMVAGPFAQNFAVCLSKNTTLERSRKRWFKKFPCTM